LFEILIGSPVGAKMKIMIILTTTKNENSKNTVGYAYARINHHEGNFLAYELTQISPKFPKNCGLMSYAYATVLEKK